MPWSLVEELSIAGGDRRAFYPPIASLPPQRTEVGLVDPNQFALADARANLNDPFFQNPNDPVLTIRINPPNGGYVNQGNLPDPAFRLHAVTSGRLWFRPATAAMEAHLILEMPIFQLITQQQVPWWERWTEVGQGVCIPYLLVYENINVAELASLVNNLVHSDSFFGLSLPTEVSNDLVARQAYIDEFLQGSRIDFERPLIVREAGAVIGTAAADSDPAAPADQRLVRLHACYLGPTPIAPYAFAEDHGQTPMNPRELLYLLFGNDSEEVLRTQHPLLMRMDDQGRNSPLGVLEARTMRLRPPLRTIARVRWETDIDITNPNYTLSVDHRIGSGGV